jgi:hypothetical protein
VVVENTRRDYWFTEKLVDCFATGTIPLYYGCRSIDQLFKKDGMHVWTTLDELEGILKRIGPEDYVQRLPVISENMRLARQYRCAEDWIYERYPEYFE